MDADVVNAQSLWAILWGSPGQFHEVRIGTAQCWVPVERPFAFQRLLSLDDCRISMVPRAGQHELTYATAHVLWARLETPDCCLRLQRFRVPPTLVIREGTSSRRTALWALSEPLEGDWIVKATERLAYCLKGRRQAASPTSVFPSPFTRITFGRKTPTRCYAEFESDTYATARQIVGNLGDAPALNTAWREAA